MTLYDLLPYTDNKIVAVYDTTFDRTYDITKLEEDYCKSHIVKKITVESRFYAIRIEVEQMNICDMYPDSCFNISPYKIVNCRCDNCVYIVDGLCTKKVIVIDDDACKSYKERTWKNE